MRVGPIAVLFDGRRTAAEREGDSRWFTKGLTLRGAVNQAWLADGAKAQQRRE
jgi:hypothetical protein